MPPSPTAAGSGARSRISVSISVYPRFRSLGHLQSCCAYDTTRATRAGLCIITYAADELCFDFVCVSVCQQKERERERERTAAQCIVIGPVCGFVFVGLLPR